MRREGADAESQWARSHRPPRSNAVGFAAGGDEVFEGNRTDVTTVVEIVETVEGRYGKGETPAFFKRRLPGILGCPRVRRIMALPPVARLP